MKSQEKIPDIKTTNHLQITRSTNYRAILTAAILVALGAGSMFLPQVALGIALIVIGIILFIVKFKRTVYEKTGSTIKSHYYFIQKEKLAQLESMLSEENFKDAMPVKFESDGNAKVELISSEDKQFLAVQLLEYVPFSYNPYTSILYFTDNKATELLSYFDKCKAAK
ncbi:MAG: hypothetical protein ABFC28_03600 [Rikenellaceae bacterium]